MTDHGSGIPEEFQPKLFEKFTQSDASDTRQKGGTGLGLNITKKIIEKHSGYMGFVTKEGIGTTIYFDLPDLIGEIDESDTPLRVIQPNSPCILIIEEDSDTAMQMKRMLTEAGYNADVITNTDQARQQLQDGACRYKLIILAINPQKEDDSSPGALLNNATTRNISMLVVSENPDELKANVKFSATGMVDYIQKPIEQSSLIGAVKQALDPGL